MKNKIILLAAFFIFIYSFSANAQTISGIKMVSGRADTVYRSSHIIVGTAKPGSEVYINGNKVKQYKTGSFGAEVTLKEGANQFEIKVKNDSEDLKQIYSVFYKIAQPQQAKIVAADYPDPVVETLPGAYLNYGAGDDRLGGAKISFVSEGVKMVLLDSVNTLYKVRLSEKSYCYIPKEYVKRTESGTRPPFSLTGSWSVINAGKYDKIRISLEQRQPYTIGFEHDSGRIIIDIYGAACNSNWITQYLDVNAIDYVDFQQKEPDIFRVIVKLKDKYCWGYSVDYQGNALEISVKHSPKPTLKGMTIGLDAGHGGSASGAVSPSGYKEKDMNLAMVYMLKTELEKRGANVVLSRKDDSDMTMAERKSIFKSADIDLLISIHCNASGNPLVSGGTSTYYRHIEYRDLAKTILSRLVTIDGGTKNFGLVGNFNFSLNAPTDYPSVLVETLFLSSLPDEEKITDPAFQKIFMKAVAKGLEDYLKKVKRAK